MAESLFATLECELLAQRKSRNQAEARMAIFEFIDGWYNPRRATRRSATSARLSSSAARAYELALEGDDTKDRPPHWLRSDVRRGAAPKYPSQALTCAHSQFDMTSESSSTSGPW